MAELETRLRVEEIRSLTLEVQRHEPERIAARPRWKLSDDGWTNTVHVPIEWRLRAAGIGRGARRCEGPTAG